MQGYRVKKIKLPRVADKADGLPRYCELLGNQMVLSDYGYGLIALTCCYNEGQGFQSSGDFGQDFQTWRSMTERMSDDLKRGLSSTCLGCPALKSGISPDKPKFREINISTGIPGGERCNLKCYYCIYHKNGVLREQKNNGGYNVLDVLNWIEQNIDSEPFHIDYAAGEITISPYCEKIIRLWKKSRWQGRILSNCTIYNQDVAELLRDRQVVMNCSLDAGTAETYKRIKGADCYERVFCTLKKYAATGAKIQLKYILLQGVNDNEIYVRCFCEIAGEVASEVILSRDCNDHSDGLTEREMEMVRLFISLCRDKDLPVSFVDANMDAKGLEFINTVLS